MLRQVKNSHVAPRLIGFAATSNSTSPSLNIGLGDIGTVSGTTGNTVCPFANPFSRTPVLVTSKGSSVAANGAAYVNAAPTGLTATLSSHSGGAGSADDGLVYALAFGWKSSDATKYRKSGFVTRCSWRKPRILAFKVDTTSPTISIGNNHATAVKNGTGDVTLTFRVPFGNDNIIPIPTAISSAAAETEVTSVNSYSVRIKRTASGSASDGAFYLLVYGSQARENLYNRFQILETNQRFPRIIPIHITYTAGTPAITVGTGDVTLTDTGTGDVAVAFTDTFKREPIVVSNLVGTAGIATIKAAATSSGVSLTSFNAGGSAADPTGVMAFIIGFDDATEY